MPENATVYAPMRFFPGEQQLQPLAPEAAITVDGEARKASMTWPDGLTLRLARMPDEQMGKHLSGLRGFVLQQGAGEGLAIRVLSTLSVYGIVIEPGFDDAGRAMAFVARLTGATDGLCFLGGDLVDRSGTSLLAGLPLPTARRAAERALVLLTLSFRSLLEQDAGTDGEPEAEKLRQELVSWMKRFEQVVAEAEPQELALIEAPIGAAEGQAITDGVWRAEGAQVLLWALGQRDLPAHDAQEHPYDVARAVGILSEGSPKVFENAALRTPEDLDWMRRRLLALHWRMVENRVNPGAKVDFPKLAEKGFLGGFDLAHIPLEGDDLTIAGGAITAADPARVGLAASTAVERHKAINWLIGAHPMYSRVVTPT